LNAAGLGSVMILVALGAVATNAVLVLVHTIVMLLWYALHGYRCLRQRTTVAQTGQQHDQKIGLLLSKLRSIAANDLRTAVAPSYTRLCGDCYSRDFPNKTVCPICLEVFAFCRERQQQEEPQDEQKLTCITTIPASSMSSLAVPVPVPAALASLATATTEQQQPQQQQLAGGSSGGSACDGSEIAMMAICLVHRNSTDTHNDVQRGGAQQILLPMCTQCRTFFHGTCLIQSIQHCTRSCPSCRASFVERDNSLMATAFSLSPH
jgi:hypothetical protein